MPLNLRFEKYFVTPNIMYGTYVFDIESTLYYYWVYKLMYILRTSHYVCLTSHFIRKFYRLFSLAPFDKCIYIYFFNIQYRNPITKINSWVCVERTWEEETQADDFPVDAQIVYMNVWNGNCSIYMYIFYPPSKSSRSRALDPSSSANYLFLLTPLCLHHTYIYFLLHQCLHKYLAITVHIYVYHHYDTNL